MKGVIFDFNGTMFFDSLFHEKAWMAIGEKYFHRHLSKEEVDKNIQGRSNERILSYLSSSPLSKEEADFIAGEKEKRYRKRARANPSLLHLAPGLVSFLDFLKTNGIPRAIATSSEKTNREWYKKVFPLSRYFEENNRIYDDGSFQKGKPDPEIYQVARKRLSLAPSSCLVFEDSLSGLKSAFAAKAGMICQAVDPDFPPSFPHPSFVTLSLSCFWPIPSSVFEFLRRK